MVNIKLRTVFLSPQKTRSALLASFLFFSVLLVGCSREDTRESIHFGGETMGTTYHITLVSEPNKALVTAESAIHPAIDTKLKEINQQMSTYIADSELMQFNASAINEWHDISEPLHEVLTLSQSISQKTNGAYDITVGPLVNLWGFGPGRHQDEIPDAAAIESLRETMGYNKLELKAGKARKLADIKLDLSSVAKGFGVDKVADVIADHGVTNYMVEIGGEIRVKGVNPQGQPWRIAIEQPSVLQQGIHKAISLTDTGMATSGDYRNYFEKDGKRFSHTIDPVTGYPITHALASVTVIARTSAEADAWATALDVLGPDKGMEIANREKLAVYMIVKDGDSFTDRASGAFEIYQ